MKFSLLVCSRSDTVALAPAHSLFLRVINSSCQLPIVTLQLSHYHFISHLLLLLGLRLSSLIFALLYVFTNSKTRTSNRIEEEIPSHKILSLLCPSKFLYIILQGVATIRCSILLLLFVQFRNPRNLTHNCIQIYNLTILIMCVLNNTMEAFISGFRVGILRLKV